MSFWSQLEGIDKFALAEAKKGQSAGMVERAVAAEARRRGWTGGVPSRSAIIGKMYRMGFSGFSGPNNKGGSAGRIKPKRPKPPQRKTTPNRNTVAGANKPRAVPEMSHDAIMARDACELEERLASAEPPRVLLDDKMTDRCCRWPLGIGTPQFYCARAKVEGADYCADHLARKFAGRVRLPTDPAPVTSDAPSERVKVTA